MVEYQLNLGLHLQELKNIQEQIEETDSKDKDIIAIEVFDENGVILFDTQVKKIGTRVNKSILAGAKKYVKKNGNDEKPVTIMDNGNGVILLPIINNYDIQVGSIALAYPEHIVTKPVNRILLYLIIVFIVSFLLFSLITFITVNIISKNLSSGFTIMKNSLEDIINGGRGSYTAPGNNERMEEIFIEFRNSAQNVLNDIDLLNTEIDSTKKGTKNGKKKKSIS